MNKLSVSSQFKETFKEVLFPLGFKLYKKTFYRISNDVLQTAMLCKTASSFTLEFDIMPLCLPIRFLYCEGYSLSNLAGRPDWECWNGVDENAFSEMLSLFREHVLPVFERGIDASSAYDELRKVERQIYTRVPDCVIPSNNLIFLCIKANRYEEAEYLMGLIIEQWNKSLGVKLAAHEQKLQNSEPDPAFDRFMAQYQELKEEYNRIASRDVAYFQELIAQNEAISLDRIAHPSYPGMFTRW